MWERYRVIIQRVLADDSITLAEVDRMRGWGFTPEFERELERIRPHLTWPSSPGGVP